MSDVLQVALFFASLAVILLAVCAMAFVFLASRQLTRLGLMADQVKADITVFLRDSHDLIRNLNDISRNVNRQMADVERMVGTVRQWTDRTDRLVNEVSSVIEPPVYGLARHIRLFRAGLTAFTQALCHPREKP